MYKFKIDKITTQIRSLEHSMAIGKNKPSLYP